MARKKKIVDQSLVQEARAQSCWALARSYSCAGSRLLELQTPEFFIPTIYLLAHAIELYLKAYLIAQGKSDHQLRKIGHDLIACIRECNELGVKSHLSLSWLELLQIARVNSYYKAKELEYFASTVKRFGSVAQMAKISRKVERGLFNPITTKSFAAFSAKAT